VDTRRSVERPADLGRLHRMTDGTRNATPATHPSIPSIRARSIVRGAARLYREEPLRVAGSAYALLMPAAVVSAGLGALIDNLRDTALADRAALLAAVATLAGILSTLGLVLYAGLLDELVGARIRGERLASVSVALRGLPLGRLLVADVIVAAAMGLGSVLGVLPGLLVVCLVAIVGPVVNIEGARPTAAVRRSARLTWPHLLTVALTILPVVALEGALHAWFAYVHEAHAWLTELIVAAVLVPSAGAYIGLAEVVLAYALLIQDPGSALVRELRDRAAIS
jgi:hypothetical protein